MNELQYPKSVLINFDKFASIFVRVSVEYPAAERLQCGLHIYVRGTCTVAETTFGEYRELPRKDNCIEEWRQLKSRKLLLLVRQC